VDHLTGEVREAGRLVAEAVGVLREPELPEDDDPARAELLHDARVVLRKGVPQRVVAVRRVHPLHVDQVLQQHRQTVRRTADLSRLPLLVHERRFLQRVLVELRDGVQTRPALVERVDAHDVRLRELHRGELALLHHLDRRRTVEPFEIERRRRGSRMAGEYDHRRHQ